MKSAPVLIFVSLYVVVKSAEVNLGDCNSDSDCVIKHLICYQPKCNCKTYTKFDGFEDSTNTSAKCVPVYNSQCNGDEDCSKLPNGHCHHAKCTCSPGWFPDLEKVKCLEAKKRGGACADNYECYQEVDKENALICKDGKNGKVCECKDDYKQIGAQCEKKIDELISVTKNVMEMVTDKITEKVAENVSIKQSKVCNKNSDCNGIGETCEKHMCQVIDSFKKLGKGSAPKASVSLGCILLSMLSIWKMY